MHLVFEVVYNYIVFMEIYFYKACVKKFCYIVN